MEISLIRVKMQIPGCHMCSAKSVFLEIVLKNLNFFQEFSVICIHTEAQEVHLSIHVYSYCVLVGEGGFICFLSIVSSCLHCKIRVLE